MIVDSPYLSKTNPRIFFKILILKVMIFQLLLHRNNHLNGFFLQTSETDSSRYFLGLLGMFVVFIDPREFSS